MTFVGLEDPVQILIMTPTHQNILEATVLRVDSKLGV